MTTAVSKPTGARSGDSWNVTLDYILGKKRAEEALGFMIACGGALDAAAGHADAVGAVLALAVPYLADWAGADFEQAPGLAGEPVRRSRSAPDGASEQFEAFAASLAGHLRAAPPAERAPLLLIGERAELYTVGAPGRGAEPAAQPDSRLADAAAAAGVASALAVPLRRFDRWFGTLVLLRTVNRPDPSFEAGPVELAVDVARRLSWVTDAFAASAAGSAAAPAGG